MHPTTPDCCRELVPGVPPASIEYATDTTRTVASLFFSGTGYKFPDIRWIWSHWAGRSRSSPAGLSRRAPERQARASPNGRLPEFRKFYYELAQGNTPGQIAALMKMVDDLPGDVRLGLSVPRRRRGQCGSRLTVLGRRLAAIERGNALNMLPRLKAG